MDWARKGPHRGEDLFYVNQLCSTACTRKSAKDRIFGASEAAQNRIKEIGADKVTNSTIGVMLDNDGNFVVLPTVAKVYHSLSDAELFRYAPITGLPEFLDLVQGACFGQSRPDGCYTAAVATAGGSGAVHHCIWNYTMPGDTVLTSAWYWGPIRPCAAI